MDQTETLGVTPPGHRSGFVGIVGRPNVGKSTMLNYFLGEHLSITSPRPQTTRTRVLGVLTQPDAQVALLDTPGFEQPEHTLGRSMFEAAKAVIDDADVLITVIEATSGVREADRRLFEHVRRSGKPALLAINKVDAIKKPLILPLIETCAKMGIFRECVPISALKGDQMPVLLRQAIALLPEGPRWFEPGQRTDLTPPQRISDAVREQILLATRQEVPHAVAVLVDQIEEDERLTRIQATILVERQGQKAIVIGKGGAMLKKIGQAARLEIERILGRRVFLGLWVKVVEDWRSNPRILKELGYQE